MNTHEHYRHKNTRPEALREEAHEIRSASNHETNSTDCKADQEQQPNWRKRIGPIRRFRLHAYGLRTARTEVLHDEV